MSNTEPLDEFLMRQIGESDAIHAAYEKALADAFARGLKQGQTEAAERVRLAERDWPHLAGVFLGLERAIREAT